MRDKIFMLMLFLMSLALKAQQDPQYNMYMFNQLAINPAYTGSKDALSTTLLVRRQWTSFEGAPRTSVISAHAPLKKKKIGLGGYLYSESIGPKKVLSAYATYSYRFKLGRGFLAFGLGTGIVNYNFNWSEINFKDQGDLQAYSNFGTRTVFDMSSGIYYQTNSFYAGVGFTHINGPTLFDHGGDSAVYYADYALKRHTFITVGKGFKLGEDYILNPSLVIKTYGNQIPSADINVNLNIKKKIWAGFSIRSGYGLVLLTQYNINPKFRVGYSVDLSRNRIGNAGGLSHEILIGYNFNISNSPMVSPRFL